MTLDAPNRDAFIHLLLEAGALQFGAFTLKSGRVSPYFFNSARFDTGARVQRLGRFYAETIRRAAPGATVVFGPAYKGVPLAVSAAMALAESGTDVGYLFNRKEAKTHGDTGWFVGREPGPGDRLVLVDDVITDGETKREAVAMLRDAFDCPIDALVIAFNRMERDAQGGDAIAGFTQASGVPVASVLTLNDLAQALAEGLALPEGAPPAQQVLADIRAYREQYGVGGA